MLKMLKRTLLENLKNIPGWRTSRKIVVFEVDDWGCIRTPSREVLETLIKQGVTIQTHRFNQFDGLENSDDLHQLFDVLCSVRDSNNNHAVITAVTNVANPDFNKIKETGYARYFYEPFTETLKRYYPSDDVFSYWKQGIAEGIFTPEFHGREHFTVHLWLKKLQEKDESLLRAFDKEFICIDVPSLPQPAKEFMAEFYITSEDQLPFLQDSIIDGIRLFKKIFGHAPKIFVPSSGIFHKELENTLFLSGIKFMYMNRTLSYYLKELKPEFPRLLSGPGLVSHPKYYSRNCLFEPLDPSYPGIGITLKQIQAAFSWRKPAIISSHRVNFTGCIDESNRRNGLNELSRLLKEILRLWPEVEFLSSAEAFEALTCRR
jgi:hypothetical protein